MFLRGLGSPRAERALTVRRGPEDLLGRGYPFGTVTMHSFAGISTWVIDYASQIILEYDR